MMYSLAAFGSAFGLAALLRRHLAVCILLALVVRVLVPPVAVGPYFWKIHPTILMILAIALARLLFDTDDFVKMLRNRRLVLIMTAGLFGYGMLDYLAGNSALLSTLMLLTTMLVAPVLLYLLTLWSVAHEHHAVRIIAWPLIALSVGEVILGEMQITQHKALVWESAYRTSWWWDDSMQRAVGTTGHGLQLGILMVVAVALMFTVPWVPLRIASIPVWIYGTMLGSARTSFVLVSILSVVLVLSCLRKPIQAIYSVLVVSFIALTYFSSKAAVVQDLFDKFQNDGQSTNRRVAAIQYFTDHVDQFWFLGFKGPRDLREAGVLNSSLENGYLAQAMVFGVLFAVIFTLVCVGLALAPLRSARRTWFAVLGALACLIGFASGNSLLSSGIETIFFWVLAGMGAGLASKAIDLPPHRATSNEPDKLALPQWRRVARGLA